MREMLMEAAYWRVDATRPPIDEALADPELSKLLADWGREGDVGVIAVDDAIPVGAAWYRFWTEDNHSYGYVAEDVPELAIGVVSERRGEGIGAALLDALMEAARDENVARVSLSVEKDNPALRLYERAGFESMGELGNAWTMIRRTG